MSLFTEDTPALAEGNVDVSFEIVTSSDRLILDLVWNR